MTATAGIDPIIVKILEAVPIQLVSPDGPQASRDAYRAIATARPPWIEVANIEDRTIPGPACDIPVRIYSPAEGGVRPVFVLIHGGGWVIGDLDTHDAVARAAAVQADAVVVSVDYRLAPEHPYPAAVEDCWAALQWVHEHAAEIGATRAALPWAVIRPVETCRQSWRNWPATMALTWLSRCCGTQPPPLTRRCRPWWRTPRRQCWTSRPWVR